MKKYWLLLFLWTFTIVSCAGTNQENAEINVLAEQADQFALNNEIPVSKDIIKGVLDNGLTYYIRVNEKPQDRAEFRLAVNAGSVLETEKQQGLAHFVEHMAFNGTKNFQKQELVEYLESIGMKFGPDINAYTGFDETVYMLQVPTDSTDAVRTGFQILEDWAHNISFEGEEIEKERGVIIEEWRLGRGAQARMRDEQFPILFKGSKYAERLPIGQKTVIDTFSHKTLRDFYKKWYRPDLMAIVAVGDFDPTNIESLIKEHFSNIPAAKDPEERETYPVPDHKETLFAIASDPEATRSSVSVYYKMDPEDEGTVADYRNNLVESAYNRMLNTRLSELTQQAEPPFMYGYSGKGQFVRSKEVYLLTAGVQEGGIERGLETLLTEARRVEQFGFSRTELERVKKTMLRWMARAYEERGKTESSVYAAEYIRNYMSQEPIPGIEYEYKLYQKYVPTIELDEVNRLASEWISDNNRVILTNLPEEEGMEEPTEEKLRAVMQKAEQQKVEPYEDTVTNEPLVKKEPDGSVIKSESYIDDLDVTEWRLSNGIRVILKSTDFKNDEIRFTAFSPGGLSLVADSNFIAGETATGVLGNSGVGSFSETVLNKKLSDKVANVRPYLGEFEEGMSGSGSPKDMETIFQLIYLYFNQPRADSSSYLAYKSRLNGYLENREADPMSAFSDSLQLILNQYHFRARPWTVDVLNEMDMMESLRIYKKRFADASDFTFVFVGNFTQDGIKPYIEKYIGGLPDIQREESWRDNGIRYPEGVITRTIKAGIEPKSRVQFLFTGPFEWNRENRFKIGAMIEVLRIKLRETLREDLGGTYGVGISSSVSRIPNEDYMISISFGCDPNRVEELSDVVFEQIDSLRTVGTTNDYLTKVQEMRRRSYETNLEENGFWVNNLEFYYSNQLDPRLILKYPELIENLTLDDIKQAAQTYFNMDNYIKVVLYPKDWES